MKFNHRVLAGALAAAAAFAAPLSAQEIALKGGVAISRFQTSGPFDDRMVATAFGGHARFRFGRIALQPELQMVTRGAAASGSPLNERMRLEYMELPLMLVAPLQFGAYETYVFGGPMLSLQARCRFIIEQNDLKTNFDCDDPSALGVGNPSEGSSFQRRVIDYGVSAGAGVSRRVGSGRVLLEGRHTWGLRDIYDGPDEDIEIRNRSFVFSIGYAIIPGEMY